MQSFKSTAFAVTLLAVSFALYCFSDSEKKPEMEQDILSPGLEISEGFLQIPGAEVLAPPANQLPANRLAMKQQNPMPKIAPRQRIRRPQTDAGRYQLASSPKLPAIETKPQALSGSANRLPAIDPISVPDFKPNNPPKTSPPLVQSQNQLTLPGIDMQPTPAAKNIPPLSPPDELPLLAPPVSQPAANKPGDFIVGEKPPEAAVRQPVMPSASDRDAGLIDALKQDFAAKPIESNPPTSTYNSLASAVSADNVVDNAVSNASNFKTPPPVARQKPATKSQAIWGEVEQLVEKNELRMALGLLSRFYQGSEMRGPQRQKLLGWLDALAAKVIYSPEHRFVAKPYVVKSGDTLASLASQWKIPAEVIYNINQSAFAGTSEVRPGMQLKVVNGPFNAEISLDDNMMTLYVKNLYAGRFPVAIGTSGQPGEGTYQVMVKSPQGYTWRDAMGNEFPPGHPQNQYGQFWVGLSGSLCIHTVPDGMPHGHQGCIGLGQTDAKDIYGMLSKDSQITIVK